VFGTSNERHRRRRPRCRARPTTTSSSRRDRPARPQAVPELPVVTIGDGAAGTFAAVVGELYRGENTPTTAAQKGVAQNLKVPAL
jgi:hypothetical protein